VRNVTARFKSSAAGKSALEPSPAASRRLLQRLRVRGAPYAGAAAAVALSVAIGFLFRRLPHESLALLMLLGVLLVAARFGLWPSVFASVLSVLALNFFFTPPLHTLNVADQGDLATLVFFLAMAGLTGNLASRTRTEMAESRAALDRVSTLLDFSRGAAAAATADEVLNALVYHANRLLGVRAAAWLHGAEGGWTPHASCGPGTALPALAADKAGAFTTPRVAGWTFLPLVSAGTPLGVLGVHAAELRREQRRVIDGLSEQASMAVQRTVLVDSLREAQLSAERERLRSALLSSVSHDLRTPLASIIGSAESVLAYDDRISHENRRDLLATVVDEAHRLDRYIQNLLDMTKLGQRNFEPVREWVDLTDLIGGAIERLGAPPVGVRVAVEISPKSSLLYAHGTLIEQALVNLVENAFDFSPPAATVTVRAYRTEEATIIDVIDEGPGIAAANREKVFDMFYRARDGDRRKGTGLGLAISRGIVAAHGGTVEVAEAPGGRGACLRITLPRSSNAIDHGSE
jgi:two-component system sensor histidine kinase KdpD